MKRKFTTSINMEKPDSKGKYLATLTLGLPISSDVTEYELLDGFNELLKLLPSRIKTVLNQINFKQ